MLPPKHNLICTPGSWYQTSTREDGESRSTLQWH